MSTHNIHFQDKNVPKIHVSINTCFLELLEGFPRFYCNRYIFKITLVTIFNLNA